MRRLSPLDPSSYSRPELAKVNHIKFSLEVDFALKVFSGNADLTVQKVDPTIEEIIFDVEDLDIESITDKGTNRNLDFELQIGEIGTKLTIFLPNLGSNKYVINIKYKTSPSATGLQWLDPEQTAGKQHPYVFSQFQTVAARTFIPCQDTPGVKTKYEAEITCPNDLTVVMSAIQSNKTVLGNKSTYLFKQDIPVPSYLIAIAIGALESKEVGPRSMVWAEKEFIEAAAYEFAETENQLKIAEEICGPYVWSRYDLLILPPSFPLEGMENPCLTFITPTCLTGDRSWSSVIAHEIAHSWSGNLVTNVNAEHFWLNEGFTMFIERKIIGRLVGSQTQDFHAHIGLSELRELIHEMGDNNPLTKLVVDLSGVHPDTIFSAVPYEKGHAFLRYLESIVGGPEEFEPFLRKYFKQFMYKSVNSNDFKKFFETEFKINDSIKAVEWDKWLYEPGMPPVITSYDKTLAQAVEQLKEKFEDWDHLKGDLSFDFNSITTLQKIQLLQVILEGSFVPINKLIKFDETYNLSDANNPEIKFKWFRIGVKSRWEQIVEPTLNWLNEIGRMRFLRPLYRDLNSWEEIRLKVVENFEKNRKNMMHLTAYTVAKDMHLK